MEKLDAMDLSRDRTLREERVSNASQNGTHKIRKFKKIGATREF